MKALIKEARIKTVQQFNLKTNKLCRSVFEYRVAQVKT